ncbi:MAG: hypothetical protein U0228_14335 [Myxococcaceae bacterium]
MEQLAPILAIGGFIAFIAGIIYIAWLVEKKRTEAMTAYAQQHGMQFEGVRPQLIQEMNSFKLFNQGHSKSVKNLMRGAKDAGAVRICDYQYTTGHGKHRTVWNQTICVLQTPGRSAPHFFCRRQRALFDALGKMFGGQDINFDDDPAFSKAYVLQTSGDEQQLRHFMSPALRELLTRLSDKNIVLEVVGDTLLLHQGRRLKPEQIDALVADAVNIRRTWG